VRKRQMGPRLTGSSASWPKLHQHPQRFMRTEEETVMRNAAHALISRSAVTSSLSLYNGHLQRVLMQMLHAFYLKRL